MSDASSSGASGSRLLLFLLLACALAGGGFYWHLSAGKGRAAPQAQQQRRQPVAVTPASTRDVEVALSGLGTVTPLNAVTVKSRVDGQLMQVLFREGQMVKAGDLLLVIDPRPFEVQLAQAQGQLLRDTAILDNARLDLKRYDSLIRQDVIAEQQVDSQRTLVRQYEGIVASDKAAVDSARLQITYCRITSPISGQVGLRQVDPGNMVRASDQTGLVTINQVVPIGVVFTLPEDQLPRVQARMRTGQPLHVDVYDREQSRKLARGELASLDNQIDTTTGTVRLKAVFTNADMALYPNQFVNAKLLVDMLRGAVAVPTVAVQRGQRGTYVYTVTPEGTAAIRMVKAGDAVDTWTVILSGLAADERVVTDGVEGLRDGTPVDVREGGPNMGGPNSAGPNNGRKDASAKNDPSDAAASAPATAPDASGTPNGTARQ